MRLSRLFFAELVLFAISPFVIILLRENIHLDMDHVYRVFSYAIMCVMVAAPVLYYMGPSKSLCQTVSYADLWRIVVCATVPVLLAMVVAFAFNRLDGVPRSLPLMQWLFLVGSLLTVRIALFSMSRNRFSEGKDGDDEDILKENVILVGVTPVTELYMYYARNMLKNLVSIEGILHEDGDLKGRLLRNVKVMGKPEDLNEIQGIFEVHGVTIDRVVLTMPFDDLSKKSRKTLLAMEEEGHFTLERFAEKLCTRKYGKSIYTYNDALGHLKADKPNYASALDPASAIAKRAFDIFWSLVLLIVLFPFTVIAALLVAYDVGTPLIFWQKRPGQGGKPFRLYKFRTMGDGVDRLGNPIPDHLRLSKIGRIMRRTRFDELPQLYHILVGEMSFVGPRPLLPRDQPKNGSMRMSVRPGVTGWAQVNGGARVSADDKLALDLYYLKHMSLLLDIKIIFKTLAVAIAGDEINKQAIQLAHRESVIVEIEGK